MGISRDSAVAVQWLSASSNSVAADEAWDVSDAIAIPENAIDGRIKFKADHGGTEASGDELEVCIMLQIDGDTENNYNRVGLVVDISTAAKDGLHHSIAMPHGFGVATNAYLCAKNNGATAITLSDASAMFRIAS